jgi:acyl carrier protein
MSANNQIRDYIAKILRETSGDNDPVTDSDSLVLSGRLSSVDVVDVLSYLESHFNFSMDPRRFDPAKFDTVDSIVAMLDEKAARAK